MYVYKRIYADDRQRQLTPHIIAIVPISTCGIIMSPFICSFQTFVSGAHTLEAFLGAFILTFVCPVFISH